MNDIVSDLCNLPTGVFSLEFLPKNEILGWVGGVPTPVNRWYGIGVYRDSLTFADKGENSDQGTSYTAQVGCLVVSDAQAVADLLHAMHRNRFVLRVEHYDGKKRIVGAPEQYATLDVSEYNPNEILGAQGFRLTFSCLMGSRARVIS